MIYTPTAAELHARHWFSRKPLTDSVSHQHVLFPVLFDRGTAKCICRLCSPASDAREEEHLQVLYVKLIEAELSALAKVVGTRGNL